MKKPSPAEQKDALTNFLRTVSNNEKLFIYSVNTGRNTRFCIAEENKSGGIYTHTSFMAYEEMNCYFFGVLAEREVRIKFQVDEN